MITLTYGDTSLSNHIESKHDLDRFLKTMSRYCKKKYGEFHYVWVAEVQENRLLRDGKSVIHYHIMTPHFIPKGLINKAWNNSVTSHVKRKDYQLKPFALMLFQLITLELTCLSIVKKKDIG